ncbi:MAG TPA: CDP-diacylglycerol--glycerol-3-phosphate 3-phosphatidyltransferase [Actinomycetota bacterium]|nr:CDP-diacylglycerol--glycerol-3-phosphate 3-phosphatidyltransferase [Actinomycetota bacterium]
MTPLGLGWPNLVSILRIVLAPVLVALVAADTRPASYAAGAVFAVGAITDGLDGYLARRYDSVTRTGQWLDPLSDKILVAAPVIAMTALDRFPWWATVVIVTRELAVSVLRAWLGTRGRAMPASWLGKLKTAAQLLAILLYLIPGAVDALDPAPFVALVMAVGLTVWSGVDYAVKAMRPRPAVPPSSEVRPVAS